MGRARLPFTKKFQPKFSVFSCANTHSATKTKSHKRKREKLLFLAYGQSKEFSSCLFENIYISGIMYICTSLELCIMYFFEIDPEWSVKLGSVSPSTPGALRSSLFCRDQTTIDQRYEGWSYWIVFNVLITSNQNILQKVDHHCHFQSFRCSNIDKSNSG